MTNANNSNAASSQSQIQTIGGDIFPRPLREWILKISRRINGSNGEKSHFPQEMKPSLK